MQQYPLGAGMAAIATDSMSSTKRVAAGVASPLEDASILLRVLNNLGPGHHLFSSAVSRAWRQSYAKVNSAQMVKLTQYYDYETDLLTTSKTTLYSAAFASPGRIALAYTYGLQFGNAQLQRIAGRTADVATLQVARRLGLLITAEVLIGAAESVPKLQWLHTEQGSPLPEDIVNYAARWGSIEALTWLQQHGCAFTTETCESAAVGAHLHILQFLREQGCEWSQYICSKVARSGDLTILQWLHEAGCPWQAESICGDAARFGSIEMLVYLKQQGCEYNRDTIANAAWGGHLAVCQYLVAEQCPCSDAACEMAATRGHSETLRFLLETGCPWDPTVCCRAVTSGSVEVLQILQQQGCAFTEQHMSIAAERGLLHICQYLRAEQCPWSVTACEPAAARGRADTLRWLHEQGCPCDVPAVRMVAAKRGHLPVMVYTMGVAPVASAAQQSELLVAACNAAKMSVVEWLLQQGAQGPADAGFAQFAWQMLSASGRT
jgi:hypothetical protein